MKMQNSAVSDTLKQDKYETNLIHRMYIMIKTE